MPRKNKPKKLHNHHHYATAFNPNYKPECDGCAFAGPDFKCLAEGGVCLKTKPAGGSGGGSFRAG